MKKNVVFILCFISASGLFCGSNVEAAAKYDRTDIGISFVKDTGKENNATDELIAPIQEDLAPPVIVSGKLPSTGELILSVIWTFIGLSIMIIFIGVYSLKRVMVSIT